jgi:hypothetical protein
MPRPRRICGSYFSFILAVSCSQAAHDPLISTTQTFHPIAHGRVLFESETILLASTVLGECRVRALKDSRDDEARIASHSQPLGYTVLDGGTKSDWTADLKGELLELPARTRFRVLGSLSYRCSLPDMHAGSADDEGLNQNETGQQGTFYRVRVLDGNLRGKEVLWLPDDDSIYADTGKRCLPSIETEANRCPEDK